MPVKNIFVHCSDSNWGEVMEFDRWHRARSWPHIGYHFVILNGKPFSGMQPVPFLDGVIEPGCRLDDTPIFKSDEYGIHVAGRNADSLGVCLVGDYKFTDKQLIALKSLLVDTLLPRFGLAVPDVLGHYEDPNTTKTCPNMPAGKLRAFLDSEIALEDLQAAIAEQNAGK